MEAIEYFGNRPINYQTLPDIMRDKVKYYLENNRPFGIKYELEELSRNGLGVICAGSCSELYHIKILNSHDEKLPLAGMSDRKKSFCCQQLLLPLAYLIPLIDQLKSSMQRPLNLVFLWRASFTKRPFGSKACAF